MSRSGKIGKMAYAAIAAFLVASPALAQTPGSSTVPDPHAAGQAGVSSLPPAAPGKVVREASLRVSMCVEQDGTVSSIKLVKSSGIPRLDETTLDSFRNMKLVPGKDKNGKAVRMCGHQTDVVLQVRE